MTPRMVCGSSEEEYMELTMAEKREFLERMRELTLNDILNREDRDEIYRVCLVACDREMASMKEEK